jgi:hypothetical protein
MHSGRGVAAIPLGSLRDPWRDENLGSNATRRALKQHVGGALCIDRAAAGSIPLKVGSLLRSGRVGAALTM